MWLLGAMGRGISCISYASSWAHNWKPRAVMFRGLETLWTHHGGQATYVTYQDCPVSFSRALVKVLLYTHLITHSRYYGSVPVGGQTSNRFQGKSARGSYKRDDIVLEMHVRCESWRFGSRARWVTVMVADRIIG